MTIKNVQADLQFVQTLIKEDFSAVNAQIMRSLKSDVALINELGSYIIHSGGKRLRPMITVLTARAAGYKGDAHVIAAALIEFIHTATLLHDDIVDHSEMRRGRETANAIWGNEASVLVGDFLYTRAFQMMVSLDSLAIMNVMANATNTIAEGEVMQLLNIKDAETDETRYMDVIYSKTAKLFEAAGEVSGLLAEKENYQDYISAFKEYGKFLGTAFQLIDDILDYTSNAETMGKNAGDDLAEGKPTLPLIYAMQNGNAEEHEFIRTAIENADISALPKIMDIIQRTNAIEYTYKKAQEAANQAIDAIKSLPESDYKQALIILAHYSVERKF